MTVVKHTEVTPSLPQLLYTAQDLFQKGYELDPDFPPSFLSFTYRADFIKTAQEPSEEVDGVLSLDLEENGSEAPQNRSKGGRPRKVKVD